MRHSQPIQLPAYIHKPAGSIILGKQLCIARSCCLLAQACVVKVFIEYVLCIHCVLRSAACRGARYYLRTDEEAAQGVAGEEAQDMVACAQGLRKVWGGRRVQYSSAGPFASDRFTRGYLNAFL